MSLTSLKTMSIDWSEAYDVAQLLDAEIDDCLRRKFFKKPGRRLILRALNEKVALRIRISKTFKF